MCLTAAHARSEVQQRHRGEGIPAAAAGALPEMSRARETAVHAAISVRAAEDLGRVPSPLLQRRAVRRDGSPAGRATISPSVGSSRNESGKHSRHERLLLPGRPRWRHTQLGPSTGRAASMHGNVARFLLHRCHAWRASHAATPASATSDAAPPPADTASPPASG